MDWTGVAAIAGVVLTAATAIANGFVARSKTKRMERLLALLKDVDSGSPERTILRGMIFDQAQKLDHQQRAPKRHLELAFGWGTRATSVVLLLGAYVLAVIILQPWLTGEEQWSSAAWDEVRPCAQLAGFGVVLLVGSYFLLSDVAKARDVWLKKESPLIPTAVHGQSETDGERQDGGVDVRNEQATPTGTAEPLAEQSSVVR